MFLIYLVFFVTAYLPLSYMLSIRKRKDLYIADCIWSIFGALVLGWMGIFLLIVSIVGAYVVDKYYPEYIKITELVADMLRPLWRIVRPYWIGIQRKYLDPIWEEIMAQFRK